MKHIMEKVRKKEIVQVSSASAATEKPPVNSAGRHSPPANVPANANVPASSVMRGSSLAIPPSLARVSGGQTFSQSGPLTPSQTLSQTPSQTKTSTSVESLVVASDNRPSYKKYLNRSSETPSPSESRHTSVSPPPPLPKTNAEWEMLYDACLTNTARWQAEAESLRQQLLESEREKEELRARCMLGSSQDSLSQAMSSMSIDLTKAAKMASSNAQRASEYQVNWELERQARVRLESRVSDAEHRLVIEREKRKREEKRREDVEIALASITDGGGGGKLFGAARTTTTLGRLNEKQLTVPPVVDSRSPSLNVSIAKAGPLMTSPDAAPEGRLAALSPPRVAFDERVDDGRCNFGMIVNQMETNDTKQSNKISSDSQTLSPLFDYFMVIGPRLDDVLTEQLKRRDIVKKHRHPANVFSPSSDKEGWEIEDVNKHPQASGTAMESDMEERNSVTTTLALPTECEVLYSWPTCEDAALLSQLSNFCFPSGVCLRRVSSLGRLTHIVYSSSAVLQGERSHCFVLQGQENTEGDMRTLYGCCITSDILISPHPFIPKSFQMSDRSWLVGPMALVILSRHPFLCLHFEVLYMIHGQLHLAQIAALPPYWPEHDVDVYGNKEKNIGSRGHLLSSAKHWEASSAKVVLSAYMAARVPSIRETFSLSVGLPDVPPLTWRRDANDASSALAEWCMPILFRCLSLDTILMLLSCVLTEKRLVVTSRSLTRLTGVVCSLIPTLRPLQWAGPFIPVLPCGMTDVLDSPVPVIVGLAHPFTLDGLGVTSVPDLCRRHPDYYVLDIDCNRMYCPAPGTHESTEPVVVFQTASIADTVKALAMIHARFGGGTTGAGRVDTELRKKNSGSFASASRCLSLDVRETARVHKIMRLLQRYIKAVLDEATDLEKYGPGGIAGSDSDAGRDSDNEGNSGRGSPVSSLAKSNSGSSALSGRSMTKKRHGDARLHFLSQFLETQLYSVWKHHHR